MLWRGMLLAGAALAAAKPAWAEPITLGASGRLTLLAGGFAQDAPFPEEPAVGRINAEVYAEKVLNNGVSVKIVFGAAVERDHPRRDPRGGRAGNCPAENPLCPGIDGRAARGYLSGFTAGGPVDNQDVRTALEQAYVLVRGAYGEFSLGRDEGVAARFSLPPPNILPAGDLLQAPIDLTGFSGLIARNDVSGQSFKLAAATPRLLGLRVGLSYTPALEAQGVDQGYRRGPAQPLTADPRHLVEFGASFDHTWRSGWRTRLAGSYASGGDATGLAAFERLESWSYGAGLSRASWSFGVSRVGSDNALAGVRRGYRATSLSIVRERGAWAGMLSGGWGREDLAALRLSAVTLGARYKAMKSLSFFGGITAAQRAVPVLADGFPGGVLSERERTIGAFLGASYSLRAIF